MFGPLRTLSPLTSSLGPSFQSPLFRPLQELMDWGRTLPPSPLTTPTPSHPHQPPLNPLRPAPQGVARWRKVYAPRFDPRGRHPFGSMLSRVQSCTPSNPNQQVRMCLQMEITNQEVLHGEEMVREVLMGMLQEMRPPPLTTRSSAGTASGWRGGGR